MPSSEFWQYAVPAGFTAVATIVTVVFTTKATNRKVDEAITYAKPTGNGFAQEVRTSLKEIQAEQNRQAVHIARMDGVLSVLTTAGHSTAAPTTEGELQRGGSGPG